MVVMDEDNYLAHYGILRKSGRYPWDSGKGTNTVAARSRKMINHVNELKRQGFKDTEIAKGLNLTTTELRAIKSRASSEVKFDDINTAQKLKDKQYSTTAIARKMGKPEATVRALLAPGARDKADAQIATMNMLREAATQKKVVQIGVGVDAELNISKERINIAVTALREEGFSDFNVQVPQITSKNNQKTSIRVLAAPGIEYKDVAKDLSLIQSIQEYSGDGGHTYSKILPPKSIDSSRLQVIYKEDGGAKADGVIYVRPGVEDISLGTAHYAQVRVAVDGTHYLKGMAMYKENMPKGVDLQFNTNKSDKGDKLKALKPMERDPQGNIIKENPFGASITRQIGTPDESGRVTKLTSAMNLVNEEGSWRDWSKTLSTQMLSKQSPKLIGQQLDAAYEKSKEDFAEIKQLTNPSVRRKLLETYSDGADAEAVHMKAYMLPRQASHAILPLESLKDTEIYAPNYKNGERVVLIRHPHGGIFEIPELKVNNNNPEGKKLLSNAPDAVGINHRVAEQLSGADFDGDTVIVIPQNAATKIKTQAPLEGLKNFDAKEKYAPYDGMETIDGGVWNAEKGKAEYPNKPPSSRRKQQQMGYVSNLITDITIMGATNEEKARAVRHSMVVIDAEKHSLDYKRSFDENGIRQLYEKYQGRSGGGGATLISRATSDQRIDNRKARRASEGGAIDPVTGEKVYARVENSYINAKGEKVYPQQNVKKLEYANDAFDLVSRDGGTPQEKLYAEHSNRMKALANQARLEILNTKDIERSPSAAVTYKPQVDSLNAKLKEAVRNSPRERQAQVLSNILYDMKKQDNPSLESDKEAARKLRARTLEEARVRTNAARAEIQITDKEWEAIQNGAITKTKLKNILDKANIDTVRQLATPKHLQLITPIRLARAKAMLNSGYTQAQVAEQIGVSVSTLTRSLKGE